MIHVQHFVIQLYHKPSSGTQFSHMLLLWKVGLKVPYFDSTWPQSQLYFMIRVIGSRPCKTNGPGHLVLVVYFVGFSSDGYDHQIKVILEPQIIWGSSFLSNYSTTFKQLNWVPQYDLYCRCSKSCFNTQSIRQSTIKKVSRNRSCAPT